jgi:hypothetical protein
MATPICDETVSPPTAISGSAVDDHFQGIFSAERLQEKMVGGSDRARNNHQVRVSRLSRSLRPPPERGKQPQRCHARDGQPEH